MRGHSRSQRPPLLRHGLVGHIVVILPSLNGPSTSHEYLSFPLLLCLPDENFPEGGVGLAALLDHLAELGPVGDAATLRLVDVLASDGVAVGPGVEAGVSRFPKLSPCSGK